MSVYQIDTPTQVDDEPGLENPDTTPDRSALDHLHTQEGTTPEPEDGTRAARMGEGEGADDADDEDEDEGGGGAEAKREGEEEREREHEGERGRERARERGIYGWLSYPRGW
ncbi:hypothetical protein FRC08_004515 [Ceratobasidium sp. 394]|nr:hypothetical protein FRC08_004515 [Ceratobasidium sp. 394]